ncbi:SusC/RagA family TonB-linked outer membrane protein [Plebeiibacterium marinum]|uniref:SusC/RagA family TonB-linked outer membrane protein n=1 Tax=Plebeiibacterium marinum TaxID=2992111 RepID=A0AAE3MDF3_9BACT|nr:SusC/RagA family TonB-linked outer membrane protein [Plebeiobacterium marinum]MCW3805499.1 SusC/RagA family TonB-linked outer membrane protein [Plebeiobacterium marinum]
MKKRNEKRKSLLTQYKYLVLMVSFLTINFLYGNVYAQEGDKITGKVTDVSGQSVIGVSILVENTNIGTITDVNGDYSITVPQGKNLVFSFIGFETQIISTDGKREINVTLKDDLTELGEVVVVGYGTMKKKDLTGSVIQIKPDNVAAEAPNTVQDLLRGVPGLKVGISTSAKGGGSMQIRGARSVSGTSLSDPLLILDGMPFYGELSEINPDDIGQIDVLKDASAAAVYGAKAANGVIIITTKKGKVGKPVVSFRTNIGFVTKADYRDVWGPEGYMDYREDWYRTSSYGLNATTGGYEAYQAVDSKGNPVAPLGYYDRPDRLPEGVSLEDWRNNGALTAIEGESDLSLYARRLDLDDVVLENYLAGKTFDWYDYAFQTGVNQDYNASISGANDKMNYYMSVGYLNNEGVVRGDEYSAIRANLKLSGKVTNWLEISSNINFQDRSDEDLSIDVGSILNNSPYANYRDSDGNLAVHPMGDGAPYFKGYNYDFDRKYIDFEKGYTIFNSIFSTKISLPFNITYTFNASPRYQFYYNRQFHSTEHPDWESVNTGVDRGQSKRFDWSLNNTINWDYEFDGVHHVNVTLVQEAEEFRSWADNIDANNIQPSDALGFHNTANAGKEESSFSSTDTHHTANGLLGRLFYSYDNRYMLTASVRRDGYSAFGRNNPYATFPSLALGWSFKNEKFFNWKAMTVGKLRVSWGKNGNRALSNPYISLSNLRNGVKLYGYLNSSGNLTEGQYLLVDRLGSPNLEWEKSEALNVGLDFGFLDNRLSGNVDVYNIVTKDMILAKQLPGFTGFGSIATNLGEVQNKGFEFTINSQNIKTDKLEWNTTFNFSYNKNKIKHLYYEYEDVLDDDGNVIGTQERDEYGKWFIGKDINTIWSYRVTGIWQADELEEAKRHGQLPGDPKVANNYTKDDVVNDDGTITPVYNDKDKEFLGTTTSPINWSMRNSFTFKKNIDFSFNMYSYMGSKYLDYNYLNADNGSNLLTYGANRSKKEYWTPGNLTNKYARLGAKGPTGAESPGMLRNRTFIRLESISLGYRLPKSLLSRWNVKSMKVFGTIRNVGSWEKDKYEYGDVETKGLMTRVYTLGLDLTF